jgi:hypothetical protein
MLSVAFIGWLVSVTDEKYLDTILVAVWVVGMIMTLFIAIVFTVVEPANSQDLNISEEQAPLLLKNALYLTADQTKFHLTYKPYSIFGEQLSHISEEEDASQLDRVFTTESIGRVTSYDSTPSYYSTPSTRLHHYSRHADLESSNMCVNSSALAALPLPASTDPLIALWTPKEDDVDYYTVTKRNKWKSQTLTLTLLLLGIAYGFINTFLIAYFYIMLDISIPILSVYIIMQILGDMVVLKVIEKVKRNWGCLWECCTEKKKDVYLCVLIFPLSPFDSVVYSTFKFDCGHNMCTHYLDSLCHDVSHLAT